MSENVRALRNLILLVAMLAIYQYEGATNGLLFCITVMLLDISETLKKTKQDA